MTTIGKIGSYLPTSPLGLGGAEGAASLAEPVIPKTPTLAKGGAVDDKKRAEVKQVANEFEALFFNLVLKSMRDTVQKGGLIDGGNAESIYKSMLDDEYAKMMASQRTTGLGDNVERYLLEAMGESPAAARAAAPETELSPAEAPPPKAVLRLEAAMQGAFGAPASLDPVKALGLKAYKDQAPPGTPPGPLPAPSPAPLLGPALPATMNARVAPELLPSSSGASAKSPKPL